MAQGYIIMFASDRDQPATHYWDGDNQIAVDNTTALDDAAYYTDKAAARLEMGRLQQIYVTQQVSLISVTKSITPTYAATPDILAPASPGP